MGEEAQSFKVFYGAGIYLFRALVNEFHRITVGLELKAKVLWAFFVNSVPLWWIVVSQKVGSPRRHRIHIGRTDEQGTHVFEDAISF